MKTIAFGDCQCQQKCVYLVTGASGFIGASLCRRLSAAGLSAQGFIFPGSNNWRIRDLYQQMQFHEVDLRDNFLVEDLIKSIRPTIIYHLAAHGGYAHQMDYDRIFASNIMGTWNLLKACKKTGYELFVNTGSSSEYGKQLHARRESDLPIPDSFYAVSKVCQSFLCQFLAHSDKQTIVTLRPFSVYGPYEEATRLIPNLMLAAIDDGPIDLVSPGTGRDFIYIDDILDLCLQVEGLRKLSGEILNVGTGIQSTIKEAVDLVSKITGKPVKARWGLYKSRHWDTDIWLADISLIRKRLGWTPSIGLEEGLNRTLEWFRIYKGLYDV